MEFLFKSICFYCGRTPAQICQHKNTNGEYIYNGIDRRDNNVGYVWGNVVPCCTTCNFRKGAADFGEFMSWINRIATHRTAPAAATEEEFYWSDGMLFSYDFDETTFAQFEAAVAKLGAARNARVPVHQYGGGGRIAFKNPSDLDGVLVEYRGELE